MAPEMVCKKSTYNKSVDWWALGIILYEMLIGIKPFQDKDNSRLMEKILS